MKKIVAKVSSPRFSLNGEQRSDIFKSMWKYSAPVLLLFLLELQRGTPLKQALTLIYAVVLQQAISILSKFVSENK